MPAPPIETAAVLPVLRSDPDPMLRRGIRGDNVMKLQRVLNAKGYKLMEDGDFGAKTEAAVRKFQKAAGIVPDAIVGAYTWAKLREAK